MPPANTFRSPRRILRSGMGRRSRKGTRRWSPPASLAASAAFSWKRRAIGACAPLHCGRGNWPDVVALYDALFALTHSPVVAINRAVASRKCKAQTPHSRRYPIPPYDPRLETYQPYWAARAELFRVLPLTAQHHMSAPTRRARRPRRRTRRSPPRLRHRHWPRIRSRRPQLPHRAATAASK